MIIQEITDLVKADGGVQSVVGTKVYSGPVLPRGYTLPAALLHVITDVTDYTFQGTSPLNEATIQLDVYGTTESEVGAVQAAIKGVLVAYAGTLDGGSIVTATMWKLDGDMPFSADINKAGLGYRVMSKFCVFYMAPVSGGGK